jgi:hypothetical protein
LKEIIIVKLKEKLEYYFEEAEQTDEVQLILKEVRTEVNQKILHF